MKLNLIVIDDDVTLGQDPFFLVEIGEKFPGINISFFEDSNEAISVIKEKKAISEKLIVLLDLGFSNDQLQGTSILKVIREKSYIIPIIIYTAADEDLRVAQDLINYKATAFMRKTLSSKEKIDILGKVIDLLDINIANAIDEWIEANPIERRNAQFITTSDGKTFTLNELLNEIRQESPTGKQFANNLLKLTVDLVARNKEKLSD
jgi:DNA-binding NtrC family response regulator